MLFSTNQTTCTSCALCLRVCPVGIIALDAAAQPYVQPHMENRCILCGHCAAICPAGALNLHKMPLKTMPVCELDQVTPHQAQALVRNRRSIRNYESKSVNRETIGKLITLSSFAPTARNGQDVRWLVISNPVELKNLKTLTMDWVRSLASAEPNAYQAMAGEEMLANWERGGDPILRNAPHLVITYGYGPLSQVDSIIALSYFELFAPVYGLGACWAGYLMHALKQNDRLRAALKLGSASEPHGAMMLGYARANYYRWPTRNPAVVKWQ